MKTRIVVLFIILSILFPVESHCTDGSASAQSAPHGIIATQWSPDGTMIAGGGTDGFLLIWDTDLNTILQIEGLEGSIFSLDWSPDSTKITAVAGDNNVRIWNVNDQQYEPGQLLATFVGHEERPIAISWSPDGSRIASGSFYEQYTLRIWNAMTFQPQPQSQLITASVWSIAWSPSSSQIAIGTGAGILVFDATLNILPAAVADDYRVGIYAEALSIAWNPDGSQIVGGYDDGSMSIWDVETDSLVGTLAGHSDYVMTVSWSPDGSKIVSAGNDEIVRVWDVNSGDEVANFANSREVGTLSIGWNPDGGQIAFGGDGLSIRIEDVPTNNSTPTQSAPQGIIATQWSPDGLMIAGGGTDGVLRIFDSDGNPLFDLADITGTIASITWSPDSEKIAAVGNDNNVRVWNVTDPQYSQGELIATFVGHGDRPISVAWSPDGSHIASVSFWERYKLKVWDALSFQSQPVAQQRTSNINAVTWSPDSTRIAVGSLVGVLVFDSSLNILPGAIPEEYRAGTGANATAVAWQPNGSLIVGGYEDGSIAIWDAESGSLVRNLAGHSDLVMTLSWSTDGSKIASAGMDSVVHIWDANSGDEIGNFQNNRDVGTASIGWSPDGSQIAFGGDGLSIRIETIPEN